MAVAFDAVSTDNNLDVSHTASGSDRVALAFVGWLTNGTRTVDDCDYGTDQMTELFDDSRVISGSLRIGLSLWYLLDPPTSAETVTATLSSSATRSCIAVVTYTGVDSIGASGSNDGNSSAPSVTFTTDDSGNLVVVASHVRGGDADPQTHPTGSNERWDTATGTFANVDIAYAGADDDSTGSSQTFTWTAAVSDHWLSQGVELVAAGGGPATAIKDIIGGGIIPAPR